LLFTVILLLTLCLLAYMSIKVFVVPGRITLLDLTTLCLFAVACLALCGSQLRCLRRIRSDTRQKLERLTFVDELTGVYNYRYLDQRITEEFLRAKRQHCPLSIICFDFDNLKQVNDALGHEAGDTVLERVAQKVRASARGEDFVGRFGGDEFLIVLPQTGSGDALITAERIKKKLDALELVASNGQRIDFLTFSMGVATYPGDTETKEELLRAADEAMYRAKRAGGDRICI